MEHVADFGKKHFKNFIMCRQRNLTILMSVFFKFLLKTFFRLFFLLQI